MNKVPPVRDGVGAVKKVGVPKAAQKKAIAKPKPEEVIEISPDDTEEENKKKPLFVNKKDGEAKKKAPTLTSVLTARSKVAFLFYDLTNEMML